MTGIHTRKIVPRRFVVIFRRKRLKKSVGSKVVSNEERIGSR